MRAPLPISLLRRAGALAAVAAACAAAAPATAGAAVTQIDAGDKALCVVDAGRVTCHGLDAASVAHVQDFERVAVGLGHACGLRASGAVLCWPADGGAPAFPPPGQFAEIGAGWSASCALDAAGAGTCWGEDPGYGVLDVPAAAGALHGLAGGEFHSCALNAADEAVCWGADVSGQASPEPGTFTALSAGGGHTCGLRPGGAVDCWGLDIAGQAQDRTAPAGETFVSVSAGSMSTCALTDAGRAVCWGANHHGETDVPAGTYTAISTGRGYACALRTTGALACWGDESPLPPHDYTVSFHAPVDAPPAVNVARAGRVVPVKVEVFDAGAEVRAGHVTVAGRDLRWDADADRWTVQLDTSDLGAPGLHQLAIEVDGDPAGHFLLKLR